jgi:hypothetical protein
MLVHIVCWKYKPEIDAATRDDHRAKLRSLPDVIPDIALFEVGKDILHLDRSYDTALVAHFSNREALEDYTVHPEHLKVAALGKEIAENVVSVDFLTAD